MNANAFRQFYDYHFAENRKIWDAYVTPLTYEQFTQAVGYSHGSVRNQIVHLMNVDEAWFSGLRRVEFPESYKPTDFDDRKEMRAIIPASLSRQVCQVLPWSVERRMPSGPARIKAPLGVPTNVDTMLVGAGSSSQASCLFQRQIPESKPATTGR